MTNAAGLELLIQRVSAWPREAQDELLRVLITMEEKHVLPYRLDAEEEVAIEEAIAQADSGDFAAEHDITEL